MATEQVNDLITKTHSKDTVPWTKQQSNYHDQNIGQAQNSRNVESITYEFR